MEQAEPIYQSKIFSQLITGPNRIYKHSRPAPGLSYSIFSKVKVKWV
jgi:hypothetical protein